MRSETTVNLKRPTKHKGRYKHKKSQNPEMKEAVPKDHMETIKKIKGQEDQRDFNALDEDNEKEMKDEEPTITKEEEKKANQLDKERRMNATNDEEYKKKKVEEKIDLAEDYEYIDMENEVLASEEEERQRKYRVINNEAQGSVAIGYSL